MEQFVSAVLVCFFCVQGFASASEPQRPNILIILADDLGYADLGCQGSPAVKTPNIDSITANGVLCTAGYVTAPQCSPSRAGLLIDLSLDATEQRDLTAQHPDLAKDLLSRFDEWAAQLPPVGPSFKDTTEGDDEAANPKK